MPEPSYDFFATGGPAARSAAPGRSTPDPRGLPPATNPYAAPAAPAVDRFGAPLASFSPLTSFEGVAPAHGRAAHAAHAAPRPVPDGVPRNVRAVATLALFFGVLLGIATMVGFSGYTALSAMVSGAGASPAAQDMYRSLLTLVLVGLVIVAATTLFLLVGGAATLANRRWGGWMLVVAFGLYLLGQVRELASAGLELMPMVTAAIAVALFLTLVTGEGRQWLLRR